MNRKLSDIIPKRGDNLADDMTIREHIATQCMATYIGRTNASGTYVRERHAECAVLAADALIAQLQTKDDET